MDWKRELINIRQEAENTARQEAEAIARENAEGLLKRVDALKNLREMLKYMLGGVGRIETLRKQDKYEIILVLSWNGPLHHPEPPAPKAKNRNLIFVGVDEKSVYVNHKPLEMITADALQEALLGVARMILKNEKDEQEGNKD